MSRRESTILALLLAVLCPAFGQAALPVQYVPAKAIVMADPAPDKRFPLTPDRLERFRARLEAAFPGQIVSLGPDRMLSPEERVIVVVPTLAAVRLGHTLRSGSIHSFDAVIVGDVTALDPWTEAALYSATRMVTVSVDIGESALSRQDEMLGQAFDQAFEAWLEATCQQLKANLSPFVLDAGLLPFPEKAGPKAGGIWPKGTRQGVKTGALLQGENGRYAKVAAAFADYARVFDIADPDRPMPPGERFALTVVEKPTDRPEPSLALRWVGGEAAAPPETAGGSLSQDAFLGLFSNYLTKDGGIKVLPRAVLDPATARQLRAVSEEISRYSKLVKGNTMTMHRETLVRTANLNPEKIVEIGVLGAYHGMRQQPDGRLEHYFRIQFGATVRPRAGDDDSGALFPLDAVILHEEELARIEMAGVRELTPADAWFTLCRNGVIHLTEKVRQKAAEPVAGSWKLAEGRVGADGTVAWDGNQAPSPSAPLQWFRPAGEIRDAGTGASLGLFLSPMTPSLGYLNANCLKSEKTRPGDILRFTSHAAGSPLVLLAEPELPEGLPDWLGPKDWLVRLASLHLTEAAGCRALPPETTGSEGLPRVGLHLSVLKAEQAEGKTTFSGQWRGRVFEPGVGPGGTPLLKFGVAYEETHSFPGSGSPLSPDDRQGWGCQYAGSALGKLFETGRNKGLAPLLKDCRLQ